jgi:hypothetical protein
LFTLPFLNRFCSDFDIFPDVAPKSTLLRFFSTLASLYSEDEEESSKCNTCFYFGIYIILVLTEGSRKSPEKGKSESSKSEVIDDHLFIEAIALCALEVQYKDPAPDPLQKVNFISNSYA